jgi:hypothetical protein
VYQMRILCTLYGAIVFCITEYRTHKLMCIKLPMYLFFYMAPGLNDSDAGKSITRAIGRGGGGLVIHLAWIYIKIITSRTI